MNGTAPQQAAEAVERGGAGDGLDQAVDQEQDGLHRDLVDHEEHRAGDAGDA